MEWLAPLLSGLGALAVLVLSYFGARRLGLTDLQKAVRVETDALIARLRARVDLLEAENLEFKSQVAALQAASVMDHARIDELERALAEHGGRPAPAQRDMISELLGFATPFAVAVMLGFGALWGIVLARAVPIRLPLAPGAAITTSFLLVQAAVRGLDSPTPELSVGRNLGAVVLWLVFIAACAASWRLAERRR